MFMRIFDSGLLIKISRDKKFNSIMASRVAIPVFRGICSKSASRELMLVRPVVVVVVTVVQAEIICAHLWENGLHRLLLWYDLGSSPYSLDSLFSFPIF